MAATPKVAIVTGSNKGIGFGIVRNLCKQFQGIVYLTSRDEGRGKAAIKKLNDEGLNPKFHLLDIDSDESVSTFANFIKQEHGGIDVLVNNAAIAFKNDATEPFATQAEVTLNTNFFSLLRVCAALFPLLRPGARVVNVSSSAGHLLRIRSDALRARFADPALTVPVLSDLMNEFVRDAKAGNWNEKGWGNSTYVVSKVGVSALTRIQAKELAADSSRPGIIVNSVHPGYVDTDMTSHKGPLTIEQGADAPTYLALLPAGPDAPNGQYFWYTRQLVDWEKGPLPTPV